MAGGRWNTQSIIPCSSFAYIFTIHFIIPITASNTVEEKAIFQKLKILRTKKKFVQTSNDFQKQPQNVAQVFILVEQTHETDVQGDKAEKKLSYSCRAVLMIPKIFFFTSLANHLRWRYDGKKTYDGKKLWLTEKTMSRYF